MSPNKRFLLQFQDDGNLVSSYLGDGGSPKPYWASGTGGKRERTVICVQGDGNVVLKTASGHPYWSTVTGGRSSGAPYTLEIMDDGSVRLYAQGQRPNPIFRTRAYGDTCPDASGWSQWGAWSNCDANRCLEKREAMNVPAGCDIRDQHRRCGNPRQCSAQTMMEKNAPPRNGYRLPDIRVINGPRNVKISLNNSSGKQWALKISTNDPASPMNGAEVLVTIQNNIGWDLGTLVGKMQAVPDSYVKAFAIVSSRGKGGIIVVRHLPGRLGEGSYDVLHLASGATLSVLAHECGHVLQQAMTIQRDPKFVEKWTSEIRDEPYITRMGNASPIEDIAEFARLYSFAVRSGGKSYNYMREIVPGRTALWEKVLNSVKVPK